MKLLLIILFLLVACATPQLEAEKPTLPSTENRVIDIQETPTGLLTAQKKLEKLFRTTPQKEFTLTIRIQSYINNTEYTENITQYITEEKQRTHTEQNIEGQTISFDSFFVDKEFTSCIYDGEWNCETIAEPKNITPNSEPGILSEEPVITQLPSRLVAGFSTQCFELRYTESTEELCLTDNGLVAYRYLSFGDEFIKEELVEFTPNVPENIFVLPQ